MRERKRGIQREIVCVCERDRVREREERKKEERNQTQIDSKGFALMVQKLQVIPVAQVRTIIDQGYCTADILIKTKPIKGWEEEEDDYDDDGSIKRKKKWVREEEEANEEIE